jgi:hypothetical protein
MQAYSVQAFPFSQVLKCYDFLTNQPFAVKVIRNKKRFHIQALVELKVLSYLMEEDRGDMHHMVQMHVSAHACRGNEDSEDGAQAERF